MLHRSNHKDVQAILRKIHEAGKNYIASVSESFKTAKSGFAFATTAQELCAALGGQDCSNEVIHGTITEMREISQKAHNDAKATTEMFDANRREFTEVRQGHAEKNHSKTIFVDPSPNFGDF
jgi:hypothetical protein